LRGAFSFGLRLLAALWRCPQARAFVRQGYQSGARLVKAKGVASKTAKK
jgi:hypothetical protein